MHAFETHCIKLYCATHFHQINHGIASISLHKQRTMRPERLQFYSESRACAIIIVPVRLYLVSSPQQEMDQCNVITSDYHQWSTVPVVTHIEPTNAITKRHLSLPRSL